MNDFFPDFVAVDLETTGLDPLKSDIIEVGATIFRGGVESEHFSSLIRPTRPVPDRISSLTGLLAGELDWAKSFSEVIPDFLDFIGELPLVAHNAEFDMGFLREKLPKIERSLPDNKIWDSLKLGVLLYPEQQSYGLEALAKFFDIPLKKTHRASEDCRITGRLFVEFLRNVPSVLSRETWKSILEDHLSDDPLSDPLKSILDHPDYDKYVEVPKCPESHDKIDNSKSPVLDRLLGDYNNDLLIKVPYEIDQKLDRKIFNVKQYNNNQRHYFSFPATQYPGDFWGVEKPWNDVTDNSDELVLYPGKKRILCQRQVKIFIDGETETRLSMTGYEIAVLKSFASSSKIGNFSRLSWWIWNNLNNLTNAVSFINASNCDPESCTFTDSCFYLKTLKKTRAAKLLAFPYRVIKEEQGLPIESKENEKALLTFFTPEGLLKDSLSGGIHTFSPSYNTVLMDKIAKLLPSATTLKVDETIDRMRVTIQRLESLVNEIISESGRKRLQKGKRHFLFIDDELIEKSAGITYELENLNSVTEEFINKIKSDSNEPVDVMTQMLEFSVDTLRTLIKNIINRSMVLCLDKIEDSKSNFCRFMFFPHIFEDEFLKLPPDISRINYLTDHIANSDDWRRYSCLLGRHNTSCDYHDLSKEIPDGNRIYLAPPSIKEIQLSKKKVLAIKGEIISNILSNFPGRTIVIVKGSQELLHFKFRLSPELKMSGYWPLFQKQDGPKGLLIKEFSKHRQVVFFGMTDLVSDIWEFENQPDNLIFESLHQTSLQDPIEAFIKKEMENAGRDYHSDYLKPGIHFALTRGLHRWKNYLEGRGRIFILDDQLAMSESSLEFLKQLKCEIAEL